MKDIYINPKTMDFELTPTGDLAIIEHALSEVILALSMRMGEFWASTELGCRIYELKKLSVDAPKLAERYVKESLKRCHVTDVFAHASEVNDGLKIEVECTDATGHSLKYEKFIRMLG